MGQGLCGTCTADGYHHTVGPPGTRCCVFYLYNFPKLLPIVVANQDSNWTSEMHLISSCPLFLREK